MSLSQHSAHVTISLYQNNTFSLTRILHIFFIIILLILIFFFFFLLMRTDNSFSQSYSAFFKHWTLSLNNQIKKKERERKKQCFFLFRMPLRENAYALGSCFTAKINYSSELFGEDNCKSKAVKMASEEEEAIKTRRECCFLKAIPKFRFVCLRLIFHSDFFFFFNGKN